MNTKNLLRLCYTNGSLNPDEKTKPRVNHFKPRVNHFKEKSIIPGLISLFNGFRALFNPKGILVEVQLLYYSSHSWGIRRFFIITDCRSWLNNNHIVSECSKLVQKGYKKKHDWGRKVIARELCNKLEFYHMTKWYKHKPESILDKEAHKILSILRYKRVTWSRITP